MNKDHLSLSRWSGEFRARNRENEFLGSVWADRYQQLRAALGVGGLIYFVFGALDLQMVHPVPVAWGLVIARLAVLLAILVYLLPDRSRTYREGYEWVTLGILMMASTVILVSLPVYGEGIIFHIASVFVLALSFYLFVPLRLSLSVYPALYLSLGFFLTALFFMHPTHPWMGTWLTGEGPWSELLVVGHYRQFTDGEQRFWIEFSGAALFLTVANVLGWVTVRRLNLLQQRQYLKHHELLAEMAVRKLAQQELAEARDNLELEVQARTSDLLEAKRQLEWQANFDPLTGLPNRWLAQDRLTQAAARSGREGQGGAVLFIGLDRMKQVNDSLGHGAGDLLLIEAARRLASLLRKEDTVARFGGDEFVVIIEGAISEQDVQPVIRKIQLEFARPYLVGEAEVFVTPSIGVSHFPSDGTEAEGLLSNADAALAQAKDSGGSTYCFYSREMNQAAVSGMRMESELRHALEREELSVYYQPLVDSQSGAIVGAEALLRWHNEHLGFVSPADFIPLAERRGLIDAIGEWVLETACTDAVAWAGEAEQGPSVAVNVSARQLQTGRFTHRLEAILDRTGIDPRRLEIELTESFLAADPDFALRQLECIRECGVRLSIDDFGTGYSALSSLRQFPFSTLKIDRSFMPTGRDDSEEARLVTAIISMAKVFGLEVIGEGVETAEQWAFLRQRQCDVLQGFYMSRPVPLPEFLALLKEGGFKPPPREQVFSPGYQNISLLHPNIL